MLSSNHDLESQSLPLRYLDKIDSAAVEKLQKKFNKSLQELESILEKKHKKLCIYKSFYSMSVLSASLMIYLQAQLSNSGVNTLSDLMFNLNVSDTTGYAIGIPSAILGTLPLLFNFSPTEKAIETILTDELTSSCLPCNSPLEFILEKFISIPTNLTGAMTGAIALSAELNKLSIISRNITIGILGTFQYEYSYLFFKDDVQRGMAFFRNRKYPWLYQLPLSTALQIIKQGMISSAGLRAFPTYFFLAEHAAKLTTLWFPPTFICAVAWMHGMSTFYVTSYLRYVETDLKINDYLYEHLAPIINNFIRHTREPLHLTPAPSNENLKKEINALLKTKRQSLENELRPTQTWKHILKKDPSIGFFTGYNALIGGVAGYEATSSHSSILLTVTCTFTGALLFSELLRQAEFKRVRNQMTLEYLEKKPEIPDAKPQTCRERTLHHLGTLLAVSAGVLAATSTIGATAKIMPENSPRFITKIISLFAVERGINNYFFQNKKLKNQISNFFNAKEKKSPLFSCCRKKR